MTYILTTTDGPCTEHKDCTATTFASEKGMIGIRHLHQWLDEPGKWTEWGRDSEAHVIAAFNMGLLLDFDPQTGEGVFDPDGVVLTVSTLHPDEMAPEERLNETYPIADDHRQPKDTTGNHPKLRRPS